MFNFLAANFFANEGGFFSEPSSYILIVMLVLFVVVMFVFPIFSKRKKGQVNDLYVNLEVGDKIMTIGGILGTILEIKERSPMDKEILIETGAEGSKTTLWIDLKGVYENKSKPMPETNFFGRPKNPEANSDMPVSAEETAEESEKVNVFGEDEPLAEPVADPEPVQAEAAPEETPAAESETVPENTDAKSTAAKTKSAAKTGGAAKTK
ncbi:MAG: preprotein translocase subunit YajC [Firmicutes bacterium]|nr:preprotein translocase subunit YajC [Bacillota bacterium]